MSSIDFLAIIQGIAALGATATAIFTFYRWIWVPRQERVAYEREKIYRPLSKKFTFLTQTIEDIDPSNIRKMFLQFGDLKDQIPKKLFKEFRNMFFEVEQFMLLAEACQSVFDDIIYQELIMFAHNHQKEKMNRPTAQNIAIRLRSELIHGKEVTPSWVKDNEPPAYKVLMNMSDQNDMEFSNMINSINRQAKAKKRLLEYLRQQQDKTLRLVKDFKDKIDKHATPVDVPMIPDISIGNSNILIDQ